MESPHFDELPEDLERVADRLRAQRPEVSALDLDRIKQRARTQAMRGGASRAGAVPRRAVSTVLAVAALTVGLGGAFAIAGGKGPPSNPGNSGNSQGSAASSQYKPGKGCGDKNHIHEREDECKKPPK